MPNTREKLIELLIEATHNWGCQIGLYGYMADHLIAHGVTISKMETVATDNNVGSKWISVKDRLPKKDGRYLVYDGDTGNYYDSYFDETEGEFGEWQNCFDTFTLGVIDCEWNSCPNVTHWMPLPEPPEGE